MSITISDNDKWIVADQGLQRVLSIDRREGIFSEVRAENYKDLPSLVGICRDRENRLFFTDSRLNQVFVKELKEEEANILSPSLSWQRPTGVAWSDTMEELWVVETAAHRLTILDRQGNFVRHIGKRGTAEGEFNYPTSLWIDKTGSVFVVDAMNSRIQILSSYGIVLSVFGEEGDATGYLGRPKGIATDSRGNIYVADGLFHTVQIFNRDGQYLSNFGEQGRETGHFWLPEGIYIDNNDFIYIADSYNSRIQVFQFVPE